MFTPTPLNLPTYPFKIIQKEDVYYIFDETRKKHLVLTPEEWVRQHFIKFLVSEKQFPASLMQIEGGLNLNQTKKRSDVLIYNATGEKLMVVECKAPSVKISQATFDQAARYNKVYQANWLAITNGLNHYYAKIDHKNSTFTWIADLPNFQDLF